MDKGTGRILWSRRGEQSGPIASTTKILTALVVSRDGELDRLVSIPATPPLSEGTIGLAPRDTFSRRQLLYAMLLPSANDAAYVLADDVGGSQAGFVADMNQLALELGTRDVHMTNPHGLPEGNPRATALAVARWARILLDDPELSRIVRTRSYRLGRFGVLRNTNRLLWSDPRVVGVKTGFTNPAGYCLVAAGRVPSSTVITVVLGEPSNVARFKDSATLLKWAYGLYRPEAVVSAGSQYATASLPDWGEKRVRLVAATDSTAVVIGGVPERVEIIAPPAVPTPVRKGQTLGFVRVTQGPRTLANVALVAAQPVAAPSVFDKIRILWERVAGWLGTRRVVENVTLDSTPRAHLAPQVALERYTASLAWRHC